MDKERGIIRTPYREAEIGQLLEQARKEKRLTLEEAEHATKIRKRYLAGLEHEDYAVLPDAVYVRGFLRTYANYLGLDGETLSREFEEHSGAGRERRVAHSASQKSESKQPPIDPGEEPSPSRGRTTSTTPTVDTLTGNKGVRLAQAVLVLVALVAVVVAFVAAATTMFPGIGTGGRPGEPPEGVKSFEVAGGGEQHLEGDLDYAQSPPVGGPHNEVWQNCGFYTQPVRDENAVHSLEHGAVWITYSPDLPPRQVERLQQLARSQTYVLVSPYPAMDSPVVASAWGKQLATLQDAYDPDLERFVRAYMQGPQVPEPGANCTGGIGQPQ
jgi:transcriptional regulator with XRE-family HTH domain